MNTHLKQLWAAMKLPKNFKKSYKFFCLGLDIRVANVVEANLRTVEPADQCLEVDIQCLETDEHAVVTGENHIVHIVP